MTTMNNFSFDYDLFVIGGGSGGVRAARLAAETGAKVALAEGNRMGGTCVMRGCVPKKLLVHASKFSEQFVDAQNFGWSVQHGRFDWPMYIHKQNKELDRLEKIYTSNLDKAGVKIFHSYAKLTGPHDIEVNEETITAKHILIATGGQAFVPDITGAHTYGITSDDIFNLKEQPKSILIVGAGYIACEFAGIFNGLGSDVTIIHRKSHILREFDNEAVSYVEKSIQDKGIKIEFNVEVEEVAYDNGNQKRVVILNDGTKHYADVVLFATGRKPNTDKIGIENLGIQTGERHEIIVDMYAQTNIPSVYAVGDVTDRVALTPVAIREAAAFVDKIFKGINTVYTHDLIASAVFTQPEMACAGISEEEARKQGDLEVYTSNFRPLANVIAERKDRYFIKLIVRQSDQVVVGVYVVGNDAAEIIQFVAVAMELKATKDDFNKALAVHPTIAEELVTLKEPTRYVSKCTN